MAYARDPHPPDDNQMGVALASSQPQQRLRAGTPYGGRLTLNGELLDLPRDLGEFVIVHELVHLLAPNHGRVFKSFLHAYLPDWQARE
jgi:hypothetical protein